jgi:hypothetical protein
MSVNDPEPGEPSGASRAAHNDTDIVSICFTDTERIEYQKAAERSGLSLFDWIRDRLREAAKREAKEA